MDREKDISYQTFKQSRFFNYFNMMAEEVKLLREKEIAFLFFQTPLSQNISGLTEFEKERLSNWEFDFNHITEKDCQIIQEIYPDKNNLEYLKQVYDGSRVYESDGRKYLADFQSKYVNIVAGKRLTYYQPATYKHRIYIYGQCTARGTGVEDKHTIPSFLQERINRKYPDIYQVENMAVGCGSDLYDDIMNLRDTKLTKGDIVLFCTNLEIVPTYLFQEHEIPYYDCSKIFCRPHEYGEWFTDSTFHTNANGNQAIAEYIFEVLEESKELTMDKESENINNSIVSQEERLTDHREIFETAELKKYLDQIQIYKKDGEKIGSIVMNCNPFTKGHQYLIERASTEVDYLYIFVVEEDRSFFSFKDRIELVKKGTAHLKNVIVLPSGKFIISAITFAGYFYKDGNKEIEVDTSKDVKIFGKYIAPALGIKIRFAGEEPNDFVTRKYNEEMRETLPKYGIQFKEIKRKEVKGQIISASLVRKLLKVKDFETIKTLVPKDTFDYLVANYD